MCSEAHDHVWGHGRRSPGGNSESEQRGQHEPGQGDTVSPGITLLAGAGLLLAGLWNRDRERLALALFLVGAILVVIAGVLAVPGFTESP